MGASACMDQSTARPVDAVGSDLDHSRADGQLRADSAAGAHSGESPSFSGGRLGL